MRSRAKHHASFVFFLIALLTVAGCGGGGGSSSGGHGGDGGDLVLVDVSVGDTDGVALNATILLEFSAEVDRDSVTPETIRVRESPANGKQVPGTFRVDGNIVEFVASLPTQADLSDSGFRPGRTYQISLPGPDRANSLRDVNGDQIRAKYKTQFATAGITSPDLFVDNFSDTDPHVVATNPKHDAVDVPQNADITITFSEPIHPATVTASNIRLTLIERPAGNVLTTARPIQARFVLTQNRESVVVGVVPDFPLADNGKYRLEIDRRVTDLSGNDLDAYTALFTLRDEPPVPGAFALDFGPGSEVYVDETETTSSWNDELPGSLAALYTFGGGDGTDGDFRPTVDTTLDGNTVTDGVFQFRAFEIPDGVTVRVTGDGPVTIRSLKTMKIEGVLDASGRKGSDGEATSTTTGIPDTFGGDGGPGGGDGGDVFTNVPTSRNSSYSGHIGKSGEAGSNTEKTGGGAADWGTKYFYKTGAGGGGGSHATAGKAGGASTYWQTIRRGVPGKAGDTDGDPAFLLVSGGGGGGAGMNGWYYWTPRSHGAGAGGGGGGGLTLECAQDILLVGSILANGGDGGSTTMPNVSYSPAGGGAGAGGMVVMRATREVKLDGATVSTRGGSGGKGGGWYGGSGGAGGDGWLRFEDADGAVDSSGSTTVPSTPSSGAYVPTSGAPSVARTLWVNLGVFDPIFTGSNVDSVIPMAGQTIKVEVRTAGEDLFDLGSPDEATASGWVDVADIATLNGQSHSFVQIRVTFTLADGQKLEDALPSIDSIRLIYNY